MEEERRGSSLHISGVGGTKTHQLRAARDAGANHMCLEREKGRTQTAQRGAKWGCKWIEGAGKSGRRGSPSGPQRGRVVRCSLLKIPGRKQRGEHGPDFPGTDKQLRDHVSIRVCSCKHWEKSYAVKQSGPVAMEGGCKPGRVLSQSCPGQSAGSSFLPSTQEAPSYPKAHSGAPSCLFFSTSSTSHGPSRLPYIGAPSLVNPPGSSLPIDALSIGPLI